MGIKVTCTYI